METRSQKRKSVHRSKVRPTRRELREATEGKATQRLEIVGEEGGAIKIDIAENLARIREFYGLANPGAPATANKPDAVVSVPAQVDKLAFENYQFPDVEGNSSNAPPILVRRR